MRWKKTFLSVLLSFALIFSTISLGWSVANEERSDTVIYALHVCFALYVFLLAVRSIGQDNPDDHSDSILHLTALLTVAFVLLGSAAILPSTRPPVITSTEDEHILLGFWYGLVGIYGIACFTAYTTPLGPPLHYPPSDIYSEKTVQSITNMDEENICGIISMFLSLFCARVPKNTQTARLGIFYSSRIRRRLYGWETLRKASKSAIYPSFLQICEQHTTMQG
jgi:hypothetical protein